MCLTKLSRCRPTWPGDGIRYYSQAIIVSLMWRHAMEGWRRVFVFCGIIFLLFIIYSLFTLTSTFCRCLCQRKTFNLMSHCWNNFVSSGTLFLKCSESNYVTFNALRLCVCAEQSLSWSEWRFVSRTGSETDGATHGTPAVSPGEATALCLFRWRHTHTHFNWARQL